jgi:hypothetical protein
MKYSVLDGKVYNEKGEVAVLVSPGYGAGWYSWNTDTPECLFDPDCVISVLNDASNENIVNIANSKWQDGYWYGARDLTVVWVKKGTKFRISEYDGFESFVEYDDSDFFEA